MTRLIYSHTFSPSRGKSGLRSAWGGEIGGAGVDKYSSPGTLLDSSLVPIHRPLSSSSGNSKEIQIEAVRYSTVKVFNFRTPKMFTVITLKFKQSSLSLEKKCPIDADGMTNRVDPDQTAPLGPV